MVCSPLVKATSMSTHVPNHVTCGEGSKQLLYTWNPDPCLFTISDDNGPYARTWAAQPRGVRGTMYPHFWGQGGTEGYNKDNVQFSV